MATNYALEERIKTLVAELLAEEKAAGTARAEVATSLGYLTNQRSRMKDAEYRQRGLPITSSPMESTIKQIHRRIKGTEKFWSEGANPMLHLVADRRSQTTVCERFWSRRLTQSATYQNAS